MCCCSVLLQWTMVDLQHMHAPALCISLNQRATMHHPPQSFAMAVGAQCNRALIEDFRTMLFRITTTAATRIRNQDPWLPVSVLFRASSEHWVPPPPPTAYLHSVMHLAIFAQLPDALCAIDAAVSAAGPTITVHTRAHAPPAVLKGAPLRLPWHAAKPQQPRLSSTLPDAIATMRNINANVRSRTAAKRYVVETPYWLPIMLAAMSDLDGVCDPALLPVVHDKHWHEQNPSLFEPAEDELIAWGLKRYGVNWETIQATLLPAFEVHQVRVRAKNLVSARSVDNPVKEAKTRCVGVGDAMRCGRNAMLFVRVGVG